MVKINIKEVKTIDVLYIEEDNYFEFVWMYGPVWRNWGFETKWHASVF